MTVYGNWGSYAQHSARLPPTPPEYQTSYLLPSESTQAYYPKHQSKRSRHKDVSERYFSAHSQNRTKHHGGMDYQMNYPQPLAMPFHYGQPAPMLPPIQVPDEVAYQCQYTQQVPENKSKEEKPTGGVAQYLDYDMDMMSNFVAEMCQQMVTRVSSSPTAQFRKYVCQILSSTRLPSSTIMLGLFYLQERMKFEKGDLSSSGSLMKMLTTCLLLGSKFLDDNTFQNRSWAEVSNISVHELNSMELQWLKDFNWEIHSLMYDPDEGFFMWVEHWHNYEEKAQYAQAKQSHKLAPINTNITRMSHVPQPMMSPEGPIPPQYQQGAQYDTTWARAHLNDGSPPSSHHSGPTTPEYYAQTWQYGVGADSFGRPWNHPNKASYASHCQQVSPYYSSHFGQGYQQVSAWSPRGAEYYMPHMGYHSQTVVG